MSYLVGILPRATLQIVRNNIITSGSKTAYQGILTTAAN